VLTGEQVRKMEPAVSAAYSALWSPNTGIVDYGVVTRSLAGEVVSSGRADIKLQFEAVQVHYLYCQQQQHQQNNDLNNTTVTR
jgi:L-2-hydroxyglutarate oxidase LhgO